MATNEYRIGEDHLGKFLVDVTEPDDNNYVTNRELRAAYESWCDDVGETAWSAQKFGRDLTARGFPIDRIGHNNDRVRLGMRLR